MYSIEKSRREYYLESENINDNIVHYRFREDYGYCNINIYIYPKENYRYEWYANNSRGEKDNLFDDVEKELLEETIKQIIKGLKDKEKI